MKAFAKKLKSKKKKLGEFNEEIEDITTVAQDKFSMNLKILHTYDKELIANQEFQELRAATIQI